MMMEIGGLTLYINTFVFHTPTNKSKKDVDVTGYDGQSHRKYSKQYFEALRNKPVLMSALHLIVTISLRRP